MKNSKPEWVKPGMVVTLDESVGTVIATRRAIRVKGRPLMAVVSWTGKTKDGRFGGLDGCSSCLASLLTPRNVRERLEYLRGEIRAERISYGEIAELQSLVSHISPEDVELLQWASNKKES
jgi:hypothetical protein